MDWITLGVLTAFFLVSELRGYWRYRSGYESGYFDCASDEPARYKMKWREEALKEMARADAELLEEEGRQNVD